VEPRFESLLGLVRHSGNAALLQAVEMSILSTQAHLVARIEAYREAAGAGVLAISHDTDLLARWCGGKGRVLAWPPRSGRVPRPAASG